MKNKLYFGKDPDHILDRKNPEFSEMHPGRGLCSTNALQLSLVLQFFMLLDFMGLQNFWPDQQH